MPRVSQYSVSDPSPKQIMVSHRDKIYFDTKDPYHYYDFFNEFNGIVFNGITKFSSAKWRGLTLRKNINYLIKKINLFHLL